MKRPTRIREIGTNERPDLWLASWFAYNAKPLTEQFPVRGSGMTEYGLSVVLGWSATSTCFAATHRGLRFSLPDGSFRPRAKLRSPAALWLLSAHSLLSGHSNAELPDLRMGYSA